VTCSALTALFEDGLNGRTAQEGRVNASKTQAGVRAVDLSFGVRDELVRYLQDHPETKTIAFSRLTSALATGRPA
jgi:hypothetical protein